PDGSRIAYRASQNNLSNLWVIDADTAHGAGAKNISVNNDPGLELYCPLWSPDGTRLAYISETRVQSDPSQQTWSVWVVNLENPAKVYQTGDFLRLLGWSSNDELIVALVSNVTGSRSRPVPVKIASISPGGSAGRELGALAETYLNNIHLSPDGRNISFVKS